MPHQVISTFKNCDKNTGGASQQVNLCMGQILTEPSQIKPCKYGKYVLNICSLTLTNYFPKLGSETRLGKHGTLE